MRLLDRQVILVTDASTWPGYNAALAVADAGAAVVINDETGAGSARAQAEETVRTIKRRSGIAIPSYGNTRDRRKCIDMVRTGPDKWDWLSGVILIGGAADLRLLIEIGAPEMAKWGGTIVALDCDSETAAVVREHAPALQPQKITINGILPSEETPASMLTFLLSSLGVRQTGALLKPALDLTPQQIAASIESLIVSPDALAAEPAASERSPEGPAKAEEPEGRTPAKKPAPEGKAPARKGGKGA